MKLRPLTLGLIFTFVDLELLSGTAMLIFGADRAYQHPREA